MRRRRTNCLSKLANFHMKLPGLKNLADSKSREDRMKMIEREEKNLSRYLHNKYLYPYLLIGLNIDYSSRYGL